MNDALTPLEDKVAQVVTLCAALQRDNASLHARIDLLTSEKAQLTQRLDTTRQRLETLLNRLPEA